YRPSQDGFLPVLHFVYGEEGERAEGTNNTYGDDDYENDEDGDKEDDDDDDDDGYYYASDEYVEDDDDDGSEDDVGSEDDDEEEEEESDEDLKSRIEAFIAKVKTGWKEELSRDQLQNNFMD
ncbi:hypothetical protein U1Q18_019467, partial [Sarracenia purpurea var. burkii]